MKKTLLRLGKHVLAVIIKTALSFFAAYFVSGPLIDAAAKERGYTGAYGSEGLLIFGTFALAYYLATKGGDALKKLVTNNNKI
ncbi:hypothetical protein FACS1894208_10410 [Clostridia bacterium]|nr:hypothetical protein FACS1894208_10410 [Clostridia bacterium]